MKRFVHLRIVDVSQLLEAAPEATVNFFQERRKDRTRLDSKLADTSKRQNAGCAVTAVCFLDRSVGFDSQATITPPSPSSSIHVHHEERFHHVWSKRISALPGRPVTERVGNKAKLFHASGQKANMGQRKSLISTLCYGCASILLYFCPSKASFYVFYSIEKLRPFSFTHPMASWLSGRVASLVREVGSTWQIVKEKKGS